MNRREAIVSLATVTGISGFQPLEKPSHEERKSSFAIDDNYVRFFNKDVTERFTLIMLADTHLFRDDQRGEAYKQYSGRMAKAYNQTRHFQNNEPTNPEELGGDIFSFPSEAAIEWVLDKLKSANLPYVYVAGNHDWHYEGMKGSSGYLRETWIQKRLLPLYQQEDPMMTVREINGVRLVVLDNSDYQITREQLAFFQKEIISGKPIILIVHIPLYAPERSMGFGCGHPEWGAKTDNNYELEKRERWPEAGHTSTTKAFYNEVFSAPNLLGVLAGHTHRQSLDVQNGIPQIVTHANAHGAYLKVEFVPAEIKKP